MKPRLDLEQRLNLFTTIIKVTIDPIHDTKDVYNFFKESVNEIENLPDLRNKESK